MMKGKIYALILTAGMIIGVIVEGITDNFYAVWGVVSFINIFATIFVFKLLQGDLKRTQETAFDKIEKDS